MQVSDAGLHLIEQFEGFSPTQYKDSVGVPTIGYGTTAADVNPLPGHVTQAEAIALIAKKLNGKYIPPIEALGVPLNQNQIDALASFDYNLGPDIFKGPGIGDYLRRRDYRDAANEMLSYDHAGGQVLLGLQRRREAEKALFLKPVVPADPYHYHWFIDEKIKINGKLLDERNTVIKYDKYRAHPVINKIRLRILRDHLSILYGRVVTEIELAGDGKEFHRTWRKNQLEHRMNGGRAV